MKDLEAADVLPPELAQLKNPQVDIPRIAKDPRLTALIQSAVESLPTTHELHLGDARDLSFVKDESVSADWLVPRNGQCCNRRNTTPRRL